MVAKVKRPAATSGADGGDAPRNTVLVGHVLDQLALLPDGCVHCVVTSPPYLALRAYGTEPQIWGGAPGCHHEWASQRFYREGGNSGSSGLAFSDPGEENAKRLRNTRWRDDTRCALCGAWRGELGQERSHDCGRAAADERCGVCYVCHMVDVFRAIWRVLRDDGCAFLNLGDCYANDEKWGGQTGGKHAKGLHGEAVGRNRRRTGVRPKNLLMMPHRVALALQVDGWIVRQDNVWHKGNGMCEAVTDRTTRMHEYVFHLVKQPRYFYDQVAILEPSSPDTHSRGRGVHPKSAEPGSGIKANTSWEGTVREIVTARNKRSVWQVNPMPFRGAHFATMPEELVELCVKVATSARACETCGAPWARMVEKRRTFESVSGRAGRSADHVNAHGKWAGRDIGRHLKLGPTVVRTTVGWCPTCRCDGGGTGRCLVLDPFMGSGTVAVVAQRLERDWLGVDLKATYARMAIRRALVAGSAHVAAVAMREDEPEPVSLWASGEEV